MQQNTGSDGEARNDRFEPGGQSRPRNPSNAEPDVLRDLVQQARGVPLDVQRITGTEIKSLRSTHQKVSATNVAVTRAVSGFWGGIFHAIGSLFSFGGSRKKVTQCDNYGHVLPKGSWDGPYPRCTNCGTEITSEDMIRGSQART